MIQNSDHAKSLEELDGEHWGDPPAESTSLVRTVYEWRRRPIGTLGPGELARLIGQNVGLRWLLPLGVKMFREQAVEQAAGGFIDGDLMYALLRRSPEVWAANPQLARELKTAVSALTEVSRYMKEDVETFLASLPEDIREDRGEG